MVELTHETRRRIARAALAASAAIADLGAAIAGDDVMDAVETEDLPPEEQEIIRAMGDDAGRGDCGLPLDECRLVHDHASPVDRRG